MEVSIYDYDKNLLYSTYKRKKTIFYSKKYDLLSTGYKIEVMTPTVFSLLRKIDYLVIIFTILIIYQILKKNEITKKLSDIKLEENIKKYYLTHDSLTKLLNRFGVEERLELPYYNCGVVLFDIDFFKKINDTYGHGQGDLVLKGISNILKMKILKTNIISRHGGEEFLLIIPNISKDNLLNLIEEIRKDIMRLELIDNLIITSSFGIFYGNLKEKNDLKNALEEADKRLYKAKNAGRNRIES
ncbi:GGDEF domain-containing protein [Cetobacterium sp.]|uniref:GGDEF domain-containing protein n=1 Tax=Cetobacterium sp. TaxID=2071632 RepID=UPI0025C4E920|nr:GGDEF domain-containing protein [Cetobacterium sp.]